MPGRIAGLWFIGTFVFSSPALFFYDQVLNSADYILGAGFDIRISVGALLEILLAISNVATAVAFFPVPFTGGGGESAFLIIVGQVLVTLHD